MDHAKANVQHGNGNTKKMHAASPRIMSMLETYDIIKKSGLLNSKSKYATQKLKVAPDFSLTKLKNHKYHSFKRSSKESINFHNSYFVKESDITHEKLVSRADMPRLKSFELVSSISSKFDDHTLRMKTHEDSTSSLQDEKNINLKNNDKKFEFNIEDEDKSWRVEFKSHNGFNENNSPLRGLEYNANGHESILKSHSLSTPRQMELTTSTNEDQERNIKGFDFDKSNEQELNAIGTYRSRGVKGVKEDCERFRLQMKILKEKANDSRIREVMVEGLVENLYKNEEAVEVIAIGDTNDIVEKYDQSKEKTKSISKGLESHMLNLNVEGKMIKVDGIDLSTMNGESKSSSPYTSNSEGKNNHQNKAHEDFKARKRMKNFNICPPNSNTSSSSSSSASSLSSLPLSHYIQKLKCLAPISRCPSNPSTNIPKDDSVEVQTSPPNDNTRLIDCHNALQTCLHSNYNLPYSTINCKKSLKSSEDVISNIPIDLSYITKHPKGEPQHSKITNTLSPPKILHSDGNTHIGNYTCQRAKKPYMTSIKHSSMTGYVDKINKKVGNIMFTNCISPCEKNYSNKESQESYNPTDGLLLQHSKYHSNEDNKFTSCEDIFTQQKMFSELKGLIEGFNTKIEVESKKWRDCFEGLEKQLGYSKDEMSKEIFEARHVLRNDIKVKLEEIMEILLRKKEVNDEQVLTILEKKFERHQLQSDIGILALKSEMKHLWNEVKDLSKIKEDIQCYIDNFIHTAKKSKVDVKNEQSVLKSENDVLNKQLQTLKQNDMQVEVENIQRLVEKIQEDNVELEKVRSVAHMEDIRERMLIMERVESLSQLYLGGLEEIRSNVSNIKINCRDRMDELEGQWIEFKRHQECYAINRPPLLTRQMLMEELETIRTEVAEIVKTEREHVQETLERENGIIQHQFMTLCTTNKREILNMMKGELNKRLQTAQNKVLLMTDALKQEMDNLRYGVGEANEGVEGLSKASSMVVKEIEVATRAAAEATLFATKAKDMLNEMRKFFESEIANVQRISIQLQENLAFEKNMVQSVATKAHETSEELVKEKEQMWLVASAARAKNLELNELLQKESSSIVDAVSIIQKERDVASQAAKEAKCSAQKAGEVLAEVLGSFNEEMTKARQMSMQLQEGLEREREGIEREREVALQHSQEAHDRFSEELELAIKDWKRAMNAEIAKAKEVTHGLEEEQRRASMTLEQAALLYPQPDQIRIDMEEYVLKIQMALDTLTQSISQLQDAREDKHQHLLVKRQDLEQCKKTWQADLNQLQQMVHVLEKRFKESTCDQSTIGKRIEMVENMQVNLVCSFEEVRNSTGDLEKTAAIWLPKYEAAAQIVNELSSKVERMDEQFQLTCGGESIMQQIARVAESKVNGLKDMVISSHLKDIGMEVKGLFERVENGDRTNCHAIAMLESRVNVLEKSLSHDSNLSLKLEYIEKNGTKCGKSGSLQSVGNLSRRVEALQRRMEVIAAERNDMVILNSNPEFNSKIVGLESRIEHVASATFTNLRLLDKKVEHVTVGVQSALDEAAIADRKCAALGSELVKVFRMFSCRQNGEGPGNNCQPVKECKESKSSQLPFKDTNEGQDLDCQSQSVVNGATNHFQSSPKILENQHPSFVRTCSDLMSPRKVIKRGKRGSVREPSDSRTTQPSETQKPVVQLEKDQDIDDYHGSEEDGSPTKNKSNGTLRKFPGEMECKLHGPLSVVEECKPTCDTNLDGRLTIEKRQERFTKNCQRTNIRLETGRIHVNVSHQLGVVNQSEKRNDLIAVQS